MRKREDHLAEDHFDALLYDAERRPHHLLAPLVVLVPSVATVAGVVLLTTSRNTFGLVETAVKPLAFAVIAVGLAITVLAGYRTYGPWVSLGTAGVTASTSLLGLLWMLTSIHEEHELYCPKSPMSIGWVSLGFACAALVFLCAATAGFRTRSPLLVIPFCVFLGVMTVELVWTYAPGPPLSCYPA